MSAHYRTYILSGGAGTRLWPLSRETFPKQFYDLAGSGKPLLIDTLDRLEEFGPRTIVTTEALRFSTTGLVNRYRMQAKIVGEPCAKNTAAAVALATRMALAEDPQAVVGVFPADHYILDVKAFKRTVKEAFETAAKGFVVTLGITPRHPATGYGYIELGDANTGHSWHVRRFVEKPSLEAAKKMLAQGGYVWNAGMFIFPAALMAEAFRKHMPKLWEGIETLKPDFSNLKDVYTTLPAQSIDYGIMEKLGTELLCVPAEMGWTDIGSWEEVSSRGQSLGDPIEVESHGNFYTGTGPNRKRIAFVGVDDLVVVDSQDAILVAKKGSGQRVKDVVETLKREGSLLPKAHSFEERPWGRFEVLMDTEDFKSKRISVWPGQKLSYQSHKKRAEHWVVVKGEAEVTLNEEIHRLKVGEHIHIPTGAKHRMANPGKDVLEFIEVQTGPYFGEDDIVRYSDDYGRT